MSWIEKINSDFIITCGDGAKYTPEWLNATKKIEYNIAEFTFPDLAGSLVKRGEEKGRQYAIEIFFQGENHLDVSESFQTSSADKRPWVILHPFYGSLTVQPTGLNIDNTAYNVTKISAIVIETITEDNPKTAVYPIDNIAIEKDKLDETTLKSFDTTPSIADTNSLKTTLAKFFKTGSKKPLLSSESEGYFNAFTTANAAVQNGTAQPIQAMRTVQAMINAPALFQVSAKERVSSMYDQFISLTGNITGITDRSSKKIFEFNGVTLLSGMALAASTPLDSDYKNRGDVFKVLDLLVGTNGAYPSFLIKLDSLQSENGGDVKSYVPDAASLIGLNQLFNFTVSSLFAISLGARQERSLICEEDTNLILLTHRFYSLDPFDNNMEEMRANNDISINELFQIKKGRKIVYYV